MKKIAILLAVLVLVSALAGCASNAELFEVEGYGIELDPGKGWSLVEESGYDLQLTNGKAYITIMAYTPGNFVDAPEPAELYLTHNEDDILYSREDVAVKEAEKTYTAGGKTITTTMYSAEYNGTENRYLSCLVQFNNEAGTFAWVLFNSTADYMAKNKTVFTGMLEKMTCTALPVDSQDDFVYVDGDYEDGETVADDYMYDEDDGDDGDYGDDEDYGYADIGETDPTSATEALS